MTSMLVTDQISLSSVSPQLLKNVNHLTRASVRPGHLDYHAYRQFLIIHGHVDRYHLPAAASAPKVPQNTTLQPDTGDRVDDKTDFRADQAFWTQHNLPEILYVFEKPSYWLAARYLEEPPLKTYCIYGKQLRDIPILPDHISSKVKGWRIEAWARFDPRMSLRDVIDRIRPAVRPTNKSLLNMRAFRFRMDCNVLGWLAMGKTYAGRRQDLINMMIAAHISLECNTTRGISWGLVKPVLGEGGGRIAVPVGKELENTVDNENVDLSPTSDFKQNPTTGPSLEIELWSDDEDEEIYEGAEEEEEEEYYDDDDEDEGAADIEAIESIDAVEDIEGVEGIEGIEGVDAPTDVPDVPDVPVVLNFEHMTVPNVFSVKKTSGLGVFKVTKRPSFYDQYHTKTTGTVDTEKTTVLYAGEPLKLMTEEERLRDARYVAILLNEFHAFGTKGRREQLSYLLDPARVGYGFVDNVGFSKPVAGAIGCIDADVVYGM